MAMVASPSAAASVPPAPPPPSCSPPQFHVLAVDDSLLDRKLIEGLLRTSSCHVTAVDSVTKALEFLGMHHQQGAAAATVPSCSYCHQQEINLIITDYCMPGMTGYDLLKTVKGSGSPLRDIPVVIMSSENVPARINRCLEEGADDFFLKPVKLSDVSKLRPHLLRGKSTPTTTTKDDHEEETRGNTRGQERPWLEIGQPQQQVTGGGGDAAADGDSTATDSPRSSNKRKKAAAPQGGAGSVLHDQRARTSSSSYAGYALPLV